MKHECRNCGKELTINQVFITDKGDLCELCVVNSVPCACGCGRRVFVNPRLAEDCWKKREAEREAGL